MALGRPDSSTVWSTPGTPYVKSRSSALPKGAALTEFLEDYRKRAGMESGLVPVGGRAPVEDVSGEAKPGGRPAAVQKGQ